MKKFIVPRHVFKAWFDHEPYSLFDGGDVEWRRRGTMTYIFDLEKMQLAGIYRQWADLFRGHDVRPFVDMKWKVQEQEVTLTFSDLRFVNFGADSFTTPTGLQVGPHSDPFKVEGFDLPDDWHQRTIINRIMDTDQ